MFHPTRPGCRGGRDNFSWDKIRFDKHRQNYLGNSTRAPHSRYGKGLYWYAQTGGSVLASSHEETTAERERRKVKEREARLMQYYIANGLGAKPPPDYFDANDGNEESLKTATATATATPTTPLTPSLAGPLASTDLHDALRGSRREESRHDRHEEEAAPSQRTGLHSYPQPHAHSRTRSRSRTRDKRHGERSPDRHQRDHPDRSRRSSERREYSPHRRYRR